MKTTKKMLFLGLLTLFVVAGAGRSLADPYQHDDNGYWDGGHHYHHWAYHNHHRGYWNDQGTGGRVFITL